MVRKGKRGNGQAEEWWIRAQAWKPPKPVNTKLLTQVEEKRLFKQIGQNRGDVKAAKNGWILALCTKNPGPQGWTAFVDKFNKDHAPAGIVPRSIPEDYPETYFLGLLQVNSGET